MTYRVLPFVSLFWLVVGCGSEVARVPLAGEGAGEAALTIAEAGEELALWTALDVKYTGDLSASYHVELVQGGKVVAETRCNPLDVSVKVASVVTNIGADHSRSYSGKMRCALVAPAAGPATLRARLEVGQRPSKLAITDISLVVKR